MNTNQRVRIDSQLLFDGFDPTKENIYKLAADAQVSPKLIYDMLRADHLPDRGFFSHGVRRVCSLLGKQEESVIFGVIPRKRRSLVSRATPAETPQGNTPRPPGVSFFEPTPAAAAIQISVRADRSPLEQPDESELIYLQPGEALEFASSDPGKTWAYDPAASVEQLLLESTFVYPDTAEPALLTAEELRAARGGLTRMLRSVVVRLMTSYGSPELNRVAQRDVPVDFLIQSMQQELNGMNRAMPDEWRELTEYVGQLQKRLEQTRRPINIRLTAARRHRAAVVFWRTARTLPILQRINGGDPHAWKALGPWIGPAGEPSRPAGPGYPEPALPAGACICCSGTVSIDGKFTSLAVHRFSSPGDCIVNDWSTAMACRLLCNDPYPGDNLGSIEIAVKIHPRRAEPPS